MSVCGRPSRPLLRPRKGGRCWSDADMTDTYEHVPWMLPSIDRLRRAWLDTCPECAPPDGQITSLNPKTCQAAPAKIFVFRFSEIHD